MTTANQSKTGPNPNLCRRPGWIAPGLPIDAPGGKQSLLRPYIVNKKPERAHGVHNPLREAWFPENERNKFANFSPSCVLIWRERD